MAARRTLSMCRAAEQIITASICDLNTARLNERGHCEGAVAFIHGIPAFTQVHADAPDYVSQGKLTIELIRRATR